MLQAYRWTWSDWLSRLSPNECWQMLSSDFFYTAIIRSWLKANFCLFPWFRILLDEHVWKRKHSSENVKFELNKRKQWKNMRRDWSVIQLTIADRRTKYEQLSNIIVIKWEVTLGAQCFPTQLRNNLIKRSQPKSFYSRWQNGSNEIQSALSKKTSVYWHRLLTAIF